MTRAWLILAAPLLFAGLALTGCGAALHTFDTGFDDPMLSQWARGEAQRLAPIYGTDPDLSTRFLDIGPQNGWMGWYDGFRITVCLRDEYGNAWHPYQVRNCWHHEWNHSRHGDLRLDDHDEEYRLELISLGLWENGP